ncbi:MAG: CpsD/CapB family tyrosine-protein kinase, partial [Synechococcales cyanobacterium RU_4_20]|nr:CpsD/CapB family tyrosine-protein kinase [Synechococcales cyanobacterium RU_4_20]
YDYIIFDTPPLSGIADAAILGTMVDGVLLVMQPGLVNIDSANVAKQLLERSSPNVLGLVANRVDLKNNGDNPFHYGGDSSSGSASRSQEKHRKDSLGSGKILGPKVKA